MTYVLNGTGYIFDFKYCAPIKTVLGSRQSDSVRKIPLYFIYVNLADFA